MQDYGNWRRTWPIFGVVMACFLLVAVSPAAQEVPKLIGRVNDYAQILTPATQRHLRGCCGLLKTRIRLSWWF